MAPCAAAAAKRLRPSSGRGQAAAAQQRQQAVGGKHLLLRLPLHALQIPQHRRRTRVVHMQLWLHTRDRQVEAVVSLLRPIQTV